MTDLPERGDVWWCEMPEIGRRPVVVLSRDAVIPRHRRALIAPCTTTIRHLPSEVLLDPGEDPVPLRSAVNLDSVESIPIAILVARRPGPATRRRGGHALPPGSDADLRADQRPRMLRRVVRLRVKDPTGMRGRGGAAG